jgi:hypothetical protein
LISSDVEEDVGVFDKQILSPPIASPMTCFVFVLIETAATVWRRRCAHGVKENICTR